MKTISRTARRHLSVNLIRLSLFVALPLALVEANQIIDVASFSELRSAIDTVNNDSEGNTFTIHFTHSFSASGVSDPGQLFVELGATTHLTIDGGGKVLNMSAADRAFYVASGNVSFINLTIDNGIAKGGDGGSGGGGGMGAGGAIYVANRGAATSVTLSNVHIINNTAQGGDGGMKIIPDEEGELTYVQGGGGGMGGNGGYGAVLSRNPAFQTYGGGGGFGINAHGGTWVGSGTGEKATDGGTGAYTNGQSGGQGYEDDSHGNGGSNGGGGGASYNEESGKWATGAAGGGGIGGEDGHEVIIPDYAARIVGGNGGYGGGGGAGSHDGGNGGWGGGGGASHLGTIGGKGGFGGGGAYSDEIHSVSGGFGGGNGQITTEHNPHRYGGGGLGAGGGIFVEKGASLQIDDSSSEGSTSFSDNQVIGGNSAPNDAGSGSALGENIFLGGDLTYHVAADSDMITISRLGGGGDTSDANVAGRDTGGDAQGGLIKTGEGILRISGPNTYAGATQIREGTFRLFTDRTHTSQYQVAANATLEITMSNLIPAAIVTEAANSKLIITSNNIDLSNSSFSEGIITIDGSASSLSSTSTDVKIGGSGTLKSFTSVATFSSSRLTLEDTTWVNGSILQYILGNGLLTSTGTSDFSTVSTEGLTVSILSLGDGLSVGDRVSLLTLEDTTTFDLALFSLTTDLEGFSGTLYQETVGDSIILGVQIASIPEPATTGLLFLSLGAVYLRYRKARSRRSL